MFKLKYFSIFIVLSMLIGCGTKSVMMTVVRPAEINLKGYDKIAVGQVLNPRGKINTHSEDLAEELTSQLVSSGRFDVVDRQHLKQIIQEQSLAVSGMIDESNAPQLGKLLGVSVMVFGRIQEDGYKEEITKDKPYKDKKGVKHQRHHRRGKYIYNVSLKLIDVETGKILTAKNLSVLKTAKKSAIDKNPDKIDRTALYTQSVSSLGKKFIRLIAPYTERVNANFETDDALPEVDRAVAMFKVGEWPDGMDLLKSATKKKKLEREVKGKTFYNLGLAQVYQGQYDLAIENIKKAIKYNPDSSRYMNALRNAKNEKKKAQELEEQL